MSTLVETIDRPRPARKLAAVGALRFHVRPDTSDVKAIAEVVTKNAYLRHFTVQPGERWLDAGSNVGAFAIVAARLGASDVLAIEAEQHNASVVARNAVANAVGDRVKVVHAAVQPDSYPADTVVLWVNDAPLALRRHSTAKARRQSIPVNVPVVRISSACADVDGAKLNIEGTEIPLLLEWTPPANLHKLVLEWSFDVDRSTATLAQALQRLRDRYPNVELSKRIDFDQPTFPYFPPNVYVHAWEES